MSLQNGVEAFLDSLRTERGLAVNTITAYQNDLKQLTQFLISEDDDPELTPVQTWSDLTDYHLIAYMRFLQQQDYAQATVARKTAAVKAFCSWLQVTGRANAYLSIALQAPRVNRYRPSVMTRAELERLLHAPIETEGGRPESLRDRAMLEILTATGMRVGELVQLEIDDLDVQKRELANVGKDSRRRTVSLHDGAMASLVDYLVNARPRLVANSERALFVNQRGHRLTRQGFWLILRTHANRIGMTGVTPHTLRHTYAIHALQNGEPIRKVQATLGHVSPSTTAAYMELATELDPSAF